MAGNVRKYNLSIVKPSEDPNADDIVGYNVYIIKKGEVKPEEPTAQSTFVPGEVPDVVDISLIDYLREQKSENANFDKELYDIHVYSLDAVGNESTEPEIVPDVTFDLTPPPKPKSVKLS